jgi:hypothetical protein
MNMQEVSPRQARHTWALRGLLVAAGVVGFLLLGSPDHARADTPAPGTVEPATNATSPEAERWIAARATSSAASPAALTATPRGGEEPAAQAILSESQGRVRDITSAAEGALDEAVAPARAALEEVARSVPSLVDDIELPPPLGARRPRPRMPLSRGGVSPRGQQSESARPDARRPAVAPEQTPPARWAAKSDRAASPDARLQRGSDARAPAPPRAPESEPPRHTPVLADHLHVDDQLAAVVGLWAATACLAYAGRLAAPRAKPPLRPQNVLGAPG